MYNDFLTTKLSLICVKFFVWKFFLSINLRHLQLKILKLLSNVTLNFSDLNAIHMNSQIRMSRKKRDFYWGNSAYQTEDKKQPNKTGYYKKWSMFIWNFHPIIQNLMRRITIVNILETFWRNWFLFIISCLLSAFLLLKSTKYTFQNETKF